MTTETLAAPCDEVFDYLVAAASGPPHVLAAQTPRQRAVASHASHTVLDVLGASYVITVLEPVRRIDFRTSSGLLRFRGMLLVTPHADGVRTELTAYLAKDRAGILRRFYEARFAGVVRRFERFPAVAAHPSWPGG